MAAPRPWWSRPSAAPARAGPSASAGLRRRTRRPSPGPPGRRARVAPRRQPAGGRLSNEEQEARRRAIELATQAQAERAAAAAAEQARRDAAAREQAAAAAAAANAAQAEAAAARAAAEAARAEASKLTAAAPAKPAAKRAPAARPPPDARPGAGPGPVGRRADAGPRAGRARRRAARPSGGQFRPAHAQGPDPARAPIDRPAFGARSAREEAMGGGESNPIPTVRRPRPRARAVQSGRAGPLFGPEPASGPRRGPSGRRPHRPRRPPGPERARRPRPMSRVPAARRRRLRPSGQPEDDRDKRFSDAGKAVSRTRGEPKRREGRLTIQSVAGDGDTPSGCARWPRSAGPANARRKSARAAPPTRRTVRVKSSFPTSSPWRTGQPDGRARRRHRQIPDEVRA